MKRISYSDASISNEDIKNVNLAAKNGWGKNHNKYVKKFENLFAKKVNSKFSLATSSCTGALHIAIASLGLKKGSEVLLCDTNWIATLSPIFYEKLKPVFVDANYKTWCIDFEKLKKKVTNKTKLIIVTHLYGNIAEINKIINFAKKKSIYVIEDAAEALGSKYKNKMCGTFGDIGCYSFHGSKIVTTGEGGMLVTNNQKIYNKCKILADHGRTKIKYKSFEADYIGFKYKMTNLQAALGISQIKKLDYKLEIKKHIFNEYQKHLKEISFNTNLKDKYSKNSYWMTNITFDRKYKIKINELINFLDKNNIEARNFFPPLTKMKILKEKININSNNLFLNSINLPSSLNLSTNQIKYVCKKIKTFLKKIEK